MFVPYVQNEKEDTSSTTKASYFGVCLSANNESGKSVSIYGNVYFICVILFRFIL